MKDFKPIDIWERVGGQTGVGGGLGTEPETVALQGWHREPYTAASSNVISVFARP